VKPVRSRACVGGRHFRCHRRCRARGSTAKVKVKPLPSQ
jgi:hypothetical protein